MKNISMLIVVKITLMMCVLLGGCVDEDKDTYNYTSSALIAASENSSKEEKVNASILRSVEIENIKYTFYKNNDFNFSVEYPKTWKPIIKDSSIVFVSDQKDISGHVTISVQVLASHKTGGEYVTVKDVLNDLIKQFKEKTKNFSIHYINDNTSIGNVKGTEIKVSYELDNISHMQAVAITEGNDYFYALIYFSSPKNYDKYAKIYEHAKKTFNLSIVNRPYAKINVEKTEAKLPITNQADCSICEEKTGEQKLWCYAVCTRNISLCENLQNREQCILNIALQTENISLCEMLGHPKKYICRRIIEDLSKNETFGGGHYKIKNDI